MGFFSKVLKPVTNLVSDVIGGTMNAVTGVTDTSKKSYQQSLALMNQENANNIKLWNMQNEYNTPAAQIARMKEAGVDVNPMTYAVGNGNMSTTASSISSSTPHMPSYSGAGNPISNLVQLMTGLENAKAISASAKQTQEATKKTKEETKILKRRNQIFQDTGIDPSNPTTGWLGSTAEAIKEGYGKVEKLTFDLLEAMFGDRGGYRPMK